MREVETGAELAAALADGSGLAGLRVQDLDLAPWERTLLGRTDLAGLVVLGGRLSHRLAHHLRRHGALVFPAPTGLPVDPYRARLYSPAELYADLAKGYPATPDARTYAWSRRAAKAHDAYATLVRAMHDDAMTDALTETLADRPVVGVMGGHALLRGSPEYAAAARLGQALSAAGRVVLTGGGPGAMEAANLGALCPAAADLDAALARLATVPSFAPSVQAWAEVALEVRERLVPVAGDAEQLRSIGVPTWFYGHEPPNVFCDGIAKYFSNALREDVLLSRATAGLVVLPGAAGTVQEIFQALTPRYYAADAGALPPFVLVGRTHWEEKVPVLPAVRALDARRGTSTQLVDTVEEAAELLLA